MPTQQDVQRLIALREARKRGMMGPTQTAALQEIERRMSMSDQVAKVVEPAMTIASSMVAEPLSGLVGIAGTILPGPQGQGADWVNRTQEALTYTPRTEGGMQNLQGLASLMQPVSDLMQGAEQSMGDFGYENFGPGVGAMMAAIPAGLTEAMPGGKVIRGSVPGGMKLFHGTDIDSADAILSEKTVRGPAFFTPRKDVAEDYAGDGEVIEVKMDPDDLKIDLDLPGARLLSVDEANHHLGNEGWTIEDYYENGFSMGVDSDVGL